MTSPPRRGLRPVLAALVLLLVSLLAAVLPAAAQDGKAGLWFERDTLNAGLGPTPEIVRRETPQSAVESFLALTAAGEDAAAAHILDLSHLSPEERRESGPALAAALKTVIERRVILDWHRLPDTPDAVSPQPTQNDPLAGEPRRSLRLWIVERDDRPVSLRLDRIKVPGADPVWVFSRQSVENIPALYDLYGPSDLERALPEALQRETIFSLRGWELIALPLLILASGGLGWAINRGLSIAAARSRRDITTEILRSLRTPAVIFAITFVIGLTTERVFVFSGRISTMLSPAVITGYVLAALIFLMNVVDVLVDRLVVKQDEDLSSREQEQRRGLATHVTAWRRGLSVVIFLAGVGFILTSANVFRTLGFSLIGTAGIATVILGFAGRDILSNILSSMQIALNQSARIGDTVLFRGYWCVVERINFTYVQLRVWDRTRLVVPVRQFVDEPFENWTMMTQELHRTIKLRLGHSVDLDRLRELFWSVAMEEDQGDLLDDTEALNVYMADQDVHGAEIWFILPCNDANTAWQYTCRVRERLMRGIARIEETDPGYLPQVPASAET
ncbi:mechanosensitive ion channel family protein [Pseudooceanicola aestuarii]|uniref:mechanosensitive ion channel family protein n=1 Tax=Pseudooceanicola aestuarii TaxID=2697319 RepID=UPI0013D7634B|nr:mechanosensitive ion channel domain-containing protein [Pseudooceanicola aestuarii]